MHVKEIFLLEIWREKVCDILKVIILICQKESDSMLCAPLIGSLLYFASFMKKRVPEFLNNEKSFHLIP